MQEMGVEVGKLAWPPGASCYAKSMPGVGWIYGGLLPHGSGPFEWILADCSVCPFLEAAGM